MARVEIATQGWGVIVDGFFNPMASQAVTLTNLDDSAATVYAARTGGSTVSLVSDGYGVLPGFVEPGTYKLQEPNGPIRYVEAVDAAKAKVVHEAPVNAQAPEYWDLGSSSTRHASINAAIDAVTAAGGGTVLLPAGVIPLTSYVSLKDKVSLVGAGREATVLRSDAGLTSAAVVATSGATLSDVTLSGFTVDGSSRASLNGIQLTTVTRVRVTDVGVRDIGQIGILVQTDSSHVQVAGCFVERTGQTLDAGHGIRFLKSPRCSATGNHVIDCKGMGVIFGDAGNPSPYGVCQGNIIRQATSSTGLECIGFTADCDWSNVMGNVALNSQDNGISITPSNCTVSGNTVDGAVNYGIATSGANTVILGNVIRNIGQEVSGSTFGGIGLTTGNHCVVVGNRVYDDQTSKTTDFGIKQVGSSDYHVIFGNDFGDVLTARMSGVTGTNNLIVDGTRPTINGSRGGNAALASLLTSLANLGLITDSSS